MADFPGLDYLIKWQMRNVAGPLSSTASLQKHSVLDDANAFWIARGQPHETMNGRLLSVLRWAWEGGHPPTSNYQTVILADSPLLFYRLQEAAGSIAVSIGLAGGLATYTTGAGLGDVALWVPRTPPAVAGGSAVTIPDASFLDVPPGAFSQINFSYEMWFKTPAAGHTLGYLLNANGPGAVINLQLIWIDNATITAHRRNAAGVMASITTPAVALDVWHHLVYVRVAGIQLALFVDGVLAGSIPDTPGGTPISDRVTVAGDATGTNFNGGMIAEVAFYAEALTPAQIAAHYAARL